MAIKLANGDYADRPLLNKKDLEILLKLLDSHYTTMSSGIDYDGYELLLIRQLKAKLERSQDRITKLKYN